MVQRRPESKAEIRKRQDEPRRTQMETDIGRGARTGKVSWRGWEWGWGLSLGAGLQEGRAYENPRASRRCDDKASAKAEEGGARTSRGAETRRD